MIDLLNKLYDKIAYWEQTSEELNWEYDQSICAILEPLKSTKTESEIVEISDLIYQATYQVRRDGFRLGAQYMAKLLMETLGNAAE